MKAIDSFLQKWRMQVAMRQLPRQVKLIDVGAHNGELFEALGTQLVEGFGIEPLLPFRTQFPKYCLEPGYFPQVHPEKGGWDAITLLAVLEHIQPSQQKSLADACWEILRPGGLVIITVPSPSVDSLLFVLKSMKLIDGMSLEEHFGFQPEDAKRIFSKPRFRLIQHKRFQMGLNHLFVFSKLEL